jgi:hypothetical protein
MPPPLRLSRPRPRLVGSARLCIPPLLLPFLRSPLPFSPLQSAPFHRRNAPIHFHFARRTSVCGPSQRPVVQLEDQPQVAGPRGRGRTPNCGTNYSSPSPSSAIPRALVSRATRFPGSGVLASPRHVGGQQAAVVTPPPHCRPSMVHLARGYHPYTTAPPHTTGTIICVELQFSLFSF